MYSATTIRLTLLALFSALLVSSNAQSVLSSGKWYTVAIEAHGVYKLTQDDFKKMGFGLPIDPKKIRVFGNPGGMLPQANEASRPVDLIENAIFVSGAEDGNFDPGDYILFFAEGSDRVQYDLQRQAFFYEKNLYSEKNFYFINVSSDDGKRIEIKPHLPGDFPLITEYDDFVHHELDQHNLLSSGREWFGERFYFNGVENFTFEIDGIIPNSQITFVSDVVGQSYGPSSFNLFWNDAPIGEQVIPQIPNTQYGVKGSHKRDTIIFNANSVGASSTNTQTIKYQFNRATSGASSAFLDFFMLNVRRKLALSGHQTTFQSIASISQPVSTFSVEGATDKCMIWNITFPDNPQLINYTLNGGVATFSDEGNVLQKYLIFDANVPSPELVGSVENQNLHGLTPKDFIIVAHPDFKSEAERLATHRQENNGWEAAVVTLPQIYQEFSSGRQDVTAIRDFLKYMYDKEPGRLKSVLLLGKGSYDYKDRIPKNTNFVPTYESRNSLAPLATYSSDDYFAFLEVHEGNWGESPVQHHTLDIGVGRLPAKTAEEAKVMVDKIIYYDKHQNGLGKWRKEISFVGDDGNNSDNYTSSHQSQANVMAEGIESSHPEFDTKKIFLGRYEKTPNPNGETIPEANEDVLRRFERGSLIINFTGHGNERQWADEKIFSDVDIEDLKNKNYPFLITATCEFGRQDDPTIVSSAELSVLRKNGGAIGLVTTARPVNAGTNFVLNQQFYTALFEKLDGRFPTLGEVFRNTKNNSASGVGNRNFSLLADPSMRLALPEGSVVVTELKTLAGSDTLKGLSTVVLKGEVRDASDALDENFNGVLSFTLYDKEVDFVTIGKNNPAFQYSEWTNSLYRGKTSVTNGIFEFEFVLTKNVSTEVGQGKLSLYAYDTKSRQDANGATLSFKVGGVEKDFPVDTEAPVLKAFMGDTTFVAGGVVNPNTTLIVNIHDESGINIGGSNPENDLVAYLDASESPFILNDYYEAYTDDFTRGTVHFPIRNLSPGPHSIRVKAWDAHGNSGETTIDFLMTDGQNIVIESLGNYPNPFSAETSVFFTHNRSGDDLKVQLSIFSPDGKQLKTYEYDVFTSSYHVELGQINYLYDFGKKLPGGLYLARLIVRSLTNGSKSERVTKLIVVN